MKNEKLIVYRKKNDCTISFISAHGMTLISLVITIIILIILASIAIYLSLGNNGIFNRAKIAREKTIEAQAREKLELVLNSELIKKVEEDNYNNYTDLNAILEEKGFIVSDDIVTADGYNFIIDREKLIIIDSLGKQNVNCITELKKYKSSNIASITLTIQSNMKIEKLEILNPDGSINISISPNENIVIKDIDVELDKEYIINVTTEYGKTITKKLIKRLDDPITTLNEFLAFRDAVNAGITYENETIRLVTDIDLSSVCNSSDGNWVPIGNTSNPFKGTFNGENHKIENVYIDGTSTNDRGLFGYNIGKIENLNITGNIVTRESRNGILVGYNGGELKNITSYGTIKGWNYTGGITGYNAGDIYKCTNNAEVTYQIGAGGKYGKYEGGIAGYSESGKIEKCINNGNITANFRIGGILGFQGKTCEVNLCINNGRILGHRDSGSSSENYVRAGGICGFIESITTGGITNCYNTGIVTSDSGGYLRWYSWKCG